MNTKIIALILISVFFNKSIANETIERKIYTPDAFNQMLKEFPADGEESAKEQALEMLFDFCGNYYQQQSVPKNIKNRRNNLRETLSMLKKICLVIDKNIDPAFNAGLMVFSNVRPPFQLDVYISGMDVSKVITDPKKLTQYEALQKKNTDNAKYISLQKQYYKIAREVQLLLIVVMSDYLAEITNEEKIVTDKMIDLFKLLMKKYKLHNGLSDDENIKNSLKKLYESVPE